MEQIFTSLLLVFLGLILLGGGSALLGNSLIKDTANRAPVLSYSADQDTTNQSDNINGAGDSKLSENESNNGNITSIQGGTASDHLPPAAGVHGQIDSLDIAVIARLSEQSTKTFDQDGIIRLASREPP
jgi:hypothetical protein